MSTRAAREFSRGLWLADWGCYANKSDLAEIALEKGFDAGLEYFREAMKEKLKKLYQGSLILHLGQAEILKHLDICFEE